MSGRRPRRPTGPRRGPRYRGRRGSRDGRRRTRPGTPPPTWRPLPPPAGSRGAGRDRSKDRESARALPRHPPGQVGRGRRARASRAMSAADSATWSGYGSPSATTRRREAVGGEEHQPSGRGRSGPGRRPAKPARPGCDRPGGRPARERGATRGWESTPPGRPACAAAASRARRRYSPDPRDDWWGVSTMATTRSTPVSSRSATASSMLGEVCLAPYRTRYSPGATASRTAASPSTWVRVRSASGEVPPMAW